MMTGMNHLDDRHHGQGIRRRQGGRPSVYHDDAYYPSTYQWFDNDYYSAVEEVARQQAATIQARDSSTGAV